jgi:hypothetical protein
MKRLKLHAEQIVPLIPSMGAGYASDHIMVEGRLVAFMYREEPNNDVHSGWLFLSGEESQEYADDPAHWAMYDLNTIANCDPAIIPYLRSPIGTNLERVPGTNQFRNVDNGSKS